MENNNRLDADALWEKAKTNEPITKKDLGINPNSSKGTYTLDEGIKIKTGINETRHSDL